MSSFPRSRTEASNPVDHHLLLEIDAAAHFVNKRRTLYPGRQVLELIDLSPSSRHFVRQHVDEFGLNGGSELRLVVLSATLEAIT